MRVIILVSALVAAAAEAPVSIGCSPLIVQQGGVVRVLCRVARHPDNRTLRAGFEDWTHTERELAGEGAPLLHEFVFRHIDCYPGPAFCEVVRLGGVTKRDTQVVRVVGMDGDCTHPPAGITP